MVLNSFLNHIVRYGWASPTTLLGLLFASLLLLTGASARWVDGVIEVAGGWLAQTLVQTSGFAALTLGHVVLGCSAECLQRLRPHEHVHVRQAERWGACCLCLPICWRDFGNGCGGGMLIMTIRLSRRLLQLNKSNL